MAIDFVNPLTAGTVLIRSDIRSQNFVSGSAGWRIEADGDAEFNSIVIRGGTVVSGTALYYDGTPAAGNLILSIAAQAGTDAFGNAYLQGLAVYSADGTIQANDTFILWESTNGSAISIGTGNGDAEERFTPQAVTGVTWDEGAMGMNLSSDFGANTPSLFLQSPSDHTNIAKSSITLLGGSPSSNQRRVDVVGDMRLLDQITQYDSDAFTSYTPVVTGGGTVTWTTRTGWWQRIGKLIFFTAFLDVNAAGSGATAITITGPTAIDRTTRQTVHADCDNITPALEGSCSLLSFTGGSGAVFDRLRGRDNTSVTGADLLAGALITITGWYREA